MELEAKFERQPIEYDEKSDREFLAFLRSLEEETDRVYLVDPKRMEDFTRAYAYIKRTLSDECTISYNQGTELCKTGWTISARGLSITVVNPEKFTEEVLDNASCFEITPYVDGTVELNVTFYGMMKGSLEG